MICEVLDGPGGNVLNRERCDEAWAQAHYPYYRMLPDEVPPVARIISRLALINRFTDQEWADLDIASLDLATDGLAARRARARLRRFLLKISAAAKINLEHPEWVANLRAIETAGLLAAGRADAILNAEPTLDERP